MADDQTPRLLRNVHFPAEPSEKLAVKGMWESFTMVAHPASERAIATKRNDFIISFPIG